MASLLEYRSQVLEKFNIYSDDNRINDDYIDSLIATFRADWYKKRSSQAKDTEESYLQTISNLEIINKSSIECGVCFDLRTKDKLPKTLNVGTDSGIVRVGSNTLTDIRFKELTLSEFPYFGNSRFNIPTIGYLKLNGYLYLRPNFVEGSLLERISVTGAFFDPKEAGKLGNCEGEPCWTDEDEYPMPDWVWSMQGGIKDQVTREIAFKFNIPIDFQNDNLPNAQNGIPQTTAGKA